LVSKCTFQIQLAPLHIGVHPDTPKKVLTMQFYLPEKGNAVGLYVSSETVLPIK
jgi:hypothetical protein